MNFGEAEQAGYKEHVVPVFSKFLRKCFTREDCRAAALPSGTTSLLAIIDDHSINYDRAVGDDFDDDAPLTSQNVSSTTKAKGPSAPDEDDDSDDDTPLGSPKASSTTKGKGPAAPRDPPTTTQVLASQVSSSSKHQRKKSQTQRLATQEAAQSLVDVTPRPLTPANDPPSCPPSAPPSPSSPKRPLPAVGAETPPINPSSTRATGSLAPDPVTSSTPVFSPLPGVKYGHPRRPRNPQPATVGHKRRAKDGAGKDGESKRRPLVATIFFI
ncbi:hypothetical protein GALMADRAFT_149138 [Galerina marginata CBS 339.88]|uniref:Uncharacterized protein n=1 Tax=Galerina marginata (strain CBS 339.88) TaxID=685588 RepID=A0A067S516_GALM3|nr:hypothetical protein GALMADRAFT_149138 [Galerina marginata CBS 339.88]